MIKKSLLVCLLIFITIPLRADPRGLSLTWFGSTCLILSDGQSSILFDPFFTRPSLLEVVSFQGLKSDPEIIKKWISKSGSSKISAIVTSHSHYDHVLDLAWVANDNRALVYGSKSTKNIALGGGVALDKIKTFDNNKTFKVGAFEFAVRSGEHPPHFLGITLAAGNITEPLKPGASAYAYKKAEDYSFLIKHPKGNILFHPSANSSLTAKDVKGFKADLVILGVANRKSSKDLLEKAVNSVEAKVIVPVHFDNIFTPLGENPKNLFGVMMSEFYKSARELSPSSKVKTLKIGETYIL